MNRLRIGLYRLPAQLITSFNALVLLTALAVGVPAILLVRGHLDRQARAQVDQGVLITRTLYAFQQSELRDQAVLASQRPTLHQALVEGDWTALPTYLSTLQMGLGLDLAVVCDAQGRQVASAGRAFPVDLCAAGPVNGYFLGDRETVPQAWMFVFQPIGDGEPIGGVLVGRVMDDSFARDMYSQTGLEHSLLVDGWVAATSLPGPQPTDYRQVNVQDGVSYGEFEAGGERFAYARFPLLEEALQVEVALSLAERESTQGRLMGALGGGILVVAVLGSILGTFLAGRVGRPLARLSEAAALLSHGDLEKPIEVESRVREVSLLAQALEGARSDLRRNLLELRRERSWGQHLLEAIVEGIVTLDRYGRITFFSQGAERITGWRRDQVIGGSCDEIFRPVGTEASFTQLIPAPGQRVKITVVLPDGRQAILAVSGARLLPPEAGAARVALVFRDVSEEEAVHRLLGHFMADAAHEFRTPLASLAASIELLLHHAGRLSQDELHELLTSAHLGTLALQTLVDNLLESASIEAGHFAVSPRPVDLEGIADGVTRMMQPLLDKYGQTVALAWPELLPQVLADPRRTAQVLINLLSNASKYGPERAEITVGAVWDGEQVRVTVADRGPGIPPAYREDIFRRFVHRDMEQDRAQVGAGLGLSVVKAIVEAHGGQVGVEGREGGGAVFWFTLPAAGLESGDQR